MQLRIIGPTRSQKMDVNWIEVQTDTGNYVFKDGHAPIVLILSKNKEIKLEFNDGATTLMSIGGGIIEVNRDHAILLLTSE